MILWNYDEGVIVVCGVIGDVRDLGNGDVNGMICVNVGFYLGL